MGREAAHIPTGHTQGEIPVRRGPGRPPSKKPVPVTPAELVSILEGIIRQPAKAVKVTDRLKAIEKLSELKGWTAAPAQGVHEVSGEDALRMASELRGYE